MKINKITNNVENGIRQEINNQMPKSVRFFNKYKSLMGERQDIVLNAVGTGVVAPFFIENKSLSKTDKKTKKYSAYRQTAMAILAVVVQAGVTIPIDKSLDKLMEKKKLGEKFAKSNVANTKAFKRIFSLGVAVATIPLSCWMLNKLYPPFMQKFFPKLCDNKTQSKPIDKSPKRRSLWA